MNERKWPKTDPKDSVFLENYRKTPPARTRVGCEWSILLGNGSEHIGQSVCSGEVGVTTNLARCICWHEACSRNRIAPHPEVSRDLDFVTPCRVAVELDWGDRWGPSANPERIARTNIFDPEDFSFTPISRASFWYQSACINSKAGSVCADNPYSQILLRRCCRPRHTTDVNPPHGDCFEGQCFGGAFRNHQTWAIKGKCDDSRRTRINEIRAGSYCCRSIEESAVCQV